MRACVLTVLLCSIGAGQVAAQNNSSNSTVAPNCSLEKSPSQDAYKSCLVDATDHDDVMRIVENVDPADASTKQRDVVYAVYPVHAEQYGFTDREEKRITDWMTSDTFGFLPSAPSVNTSNVTDAAASAAEQWRDAISNRTETQTDTETPEKVRDAAENATDGGSGLNVTINVPWDNGNATPRDDGYENVTTVVHQPGPQTKITQIAYDEETKTATLTVKTSAPNRITLADAMGAFDGGGGFAPQKTVTLASGTHKVEMPVTTVEGMAAISVSTQYSNRAYGVPVHTKSDLLELREGLDKGLLAIAGLGGGLGSLLVGYLYVRYRHWKLARGYRNVFKHF